MVRTVRKRTPRTTGTQPSLFGREAEEERSAPACTHAQRQALERDERLRGTGRAREQAFRESLSACALDYAAVLPPLLYEEVMDHLTRTDSMGLSLCFNGPLRQAMLADVMEWLKSAGEPAMRARWQALATSQKVLVGGKDL